MERWIRVELMSGQDYEEKSCTPHSTRIIYYKTNIWWKNYYFCYYYTFFMQWWLEKESCTVSPFHFVVLLCVSLSFFPTHHQQDRFILLYVHHHHRCRSPFFFQSGSNTNIDLVAFWSSSPKRKLCAVHHTKKGKRLKLLSLLIAHTHT